MERGCEAEGVVCSVQGYFENTLGTEQINIVGEHQRGWGYRQNASEHVVRNMTEK